MWGHQIKRSARKEMTDKMASETLRADFGQLYKSLRAIQAKYQGLLINEDLGRSVWVWPQARLAKLVLPLFCEQSARSKEGNYFQTWNIRNYVGQTLELSIDFYTYISRCMAVFQGMLQRKLCIIILLKFLWMFYKAYKEILVTN